MFFIPIVLLRIGTIWDQKLVLLSVLICCGQQCLHIICSRINLAAVLADKYLIGQASTYLVKLSRATIIYLNPLIHFWKGPTISIDIV